MKRTFILLVTLVLSLLPARINAYDMEEQVETNHYWSIQNREMYYEVSNNTLARVECMNGKYIIKLLRPGNVLVKCYPLDENGKRSYDVMLHIYGKAIDGSLIDPETFREECLSLVNKERSAVGLHPLLLSSQLSLFAETRAREIAITFRHTRPDGSACFSVLPYGEYQTAGENIAKNFPTPKDVVKGWMDSPGHRANILDPSFQEMGIAVYIDTTTESITYWAQLFWSR